MICERCGRLTDDENKLCLSCKESITSGQTEISKDDSVQMQDMLLWLLTPEDKVKWTREESIVVGFGVIIAILLVGTTIMNEIL